MAQYSFPDTLQQSIELEIATGVLAKGQSIHITELQRRYQAASGDLMRVLNAAVRKGLIALSSGGLVTILGKSHSDIKSVFQHTAESGLSPRSIVRSVEVVPAYLEAAGKLNLSPGEPVFRQTRTRLVNDEVIANQNNYIPIEVCPGLESVDLSHTSFQKILEGRFNAVVASIAEDFFLAPGSEEDLQTLGLPAGSQVLVVQRLSLSPAQQPLVWADIHIRSDRYYYVKELWPKAATLLE
jgi:GntR family transcriptional regulator